MRWQKKCLVKYLEIPHWICKKCCGESVSLDQNYSLWDKYSNLHITQLPDYLTAV